MAIFGLVKFVFSLDLTNPVTIYGLGIESEMLGRGPINPINPW